MTQQIQEDEDCEVASLRFLMKRANNFTMSKHLMRLLLPKVKSAIHTCGDDLHGDQKSLYEYQVSNALNHMLPNMEKDDVLAFQICKRKLSTFIKKSIHPSNWKELFQIKINDKIKCLVSAMFHANE